MNNTAGTVLIVGAGPTGMTAALELNRFGIPVRIIDKLAMPSTTSRALAVQARTLELLEPRGLSGEMLRLGNKVSKTTIHADDKKIFGIDLSNIASHYNFILMLSQAETERLLREELERRGVTIERSVEFVAIAQTAGSGVAASSGGVHVVLRHANGSLEEMKTPYLISAEGAHSSVRRTLNMDFAGTSMEQEYLLADLYVDGPVSETELSIYLSKHGFMGFFPMGDRHFRFIASEPAGDRLQGGEEPSLSELQGALELYSGMPATLHDMTWSSRFRINTRMLKSLQNGRVFFGGDSAHIHSPAGGQGMNTGIQDMIDLAWKMALVLQGKALPELLDTYGQDRLPVIHHVLNISERMTNAVQSDSAITHQLLTHVAPLLFETGMVQRKSTSTLSQIDLNYRESSFSKTDAHTGLSRAGDRVPEVSVTVEPAETGDQARTVRLATILDPTRFTLLLTAGQDNPFEHLTPKDSQTAQWLKLIDVVRIRGGVSAESVQNFDDCFGVKPAMYLVRPDAYFGFVGDKNSGSALVNWLNRWIPGVSDAQPPSHSPRRESPKLQPELVTGSSAGTSDRIAVVTHIRAKSGHDDEVRSAFNRVVSPELREAGCISYRLLEDKHENGAFVAIGEWESEELFHAHLKENESEISKTEELTDGGMQTNILRQLGQ